MNPRLPSFLVNLYREILAQPHQAARKINQHVSRNRSLSSVHRRQCHQWLLDGLRWRHDWENWLDVGVGTFEEFDAKLTRLQAQIKEEVFVDAATISRTFSTPIWLVEAMLKNRSHAQVATLLSQHAHRPNLVLRVNAWKKTREEVCTWFTSQNQEAKAVENFLYAIELPPGTPVTAMEPMRKGWVSVQDLASQYLIEQMGLQKWQTVIDGCARSGGKTLAMASYMQGQGTFYLFDIDARLLDHTKKRMRQADLEQTHVHWIAEQDPNPMPQLVDKADHVLVDAPCSSIGTLARRPWLKWSLVPEAIQQFSQTQTEILTRQAQWVKPGGQLVYATCSWLEDENQHVIQQFVNNNPDFTLTHSFQAEDKIAQGNGFFGAYLQKQS